MLENPFENLERVIHMELINKINIFPTPPDEYYAEIAELFDTDSKPIIEKINSIRVTNSTQKNAEWMVRSYQEKVNDLMGALCVILDKLEVSIDDFVISGSWHELIMELLNYLRDIMNLLVTLHAELINEYMDLSDVMIGDFLKRTRQQINDQLITLQEGSACYKAFEQLFIPLDEPKHFFYYSHLFYFQSIIGEISKVLPLRTGDHEKAEQIREILWKWNFNHPRYESIIREEYTSFLGESQGKERVKKCLEIRKTTRINKQLYGVSLYYMEPSLEKQSEIWLNTELNCTRALMAAEAIIAVNPFAEFKIKTQLSQKQLAGILRLFLEKGILQHEDRQELIRFFANFFVPVSGKGLSYASLIRSYDQQKGGAALQQLKRLLD